MDVRNIKRGSVKAILTMDASDPDNITLSSINSILLNGSTINATPDTSQVFIIWTIGGVTISGYCGEVVSLEQSALLESVGVFNAQGKVLENLSGLVKNPNETLALAHSLSVVLEVKESGRKDHTSVEFPVFELFRAGTGFVSSATSDDLFFLYGADGCVYLSNPNDNNRLYPIIPSQGNSPQTIKTSETEYSNGVKVVYARTSLGRTGGSPFTLYRSYFTGNDLYDASNWVTEQVYSLYAPWSSLHLDYTSVSNGRPTVWIGQNRNSTPRTLTTWSCALIYNGTTYDLANYIDDPRAAPQAFASSAQYGFQMSSSYTTGGNEPQLVKWTVDPVSTNYGNWKLETLNVAYYARADKYASSIDPIFGLVQSITILSATKLLVGDTSATKGVLVEWDLTTGTGQVVFGSTSQGTTMVVGQGVDNGAVFCGGTSGNIELDGSIIYQWNANIYKYNPTTREMILYSVPFMR